MKMRSMQSFLLFIAFLTNHLQAHAAPLMKVIMTSGSASQRDGAVMSLRTRASSASTASPPARCAPGRNSSQPVLADSEKLAIPYQGSGLMARRGFVTSSPAAVDSRAQSLIG